MGEIKLSNKLFWDAEECNDIVKKIITGEEHPEHKHLIFCNFKCKFKDTLTGQNWDKLGKINRINDLMWCECNLDFILVINHSIWINLTDDQKETTLLHFLSKIKVYIKYKDRKKKSLKSPEDGDSFDYAVTPSGRIDYTIVPPDIEEYESVGKDKKEIYSEIKKIIKSKQNED